jgi:branched-chain amino acid transport system ATP-binding protein
MLEATHIVMAFGGVVALDDIDFRVPDGAAIGLLGQNGSGKTTLLNVITGHLRPQKGSVSFRGQSMVGLPPNAFGRAGIARVFQSVQVFPRLTVTENVTVSQIAASNDRALALTVREALERVSLSDLADELAGDISYGHQRLLEIAMALAAEAKLILLDEPTAGLAPSLVETVVTCLKEINGRGTSLVLIEHETEVVFRVCQEVYVLSEGRVLARGTPAEIRSNAQVLDLYLGTTV